MLCRSRAIKQDFCFLTVVTLAFSGLFLILVCIIIFNYVELASDKHYPKFTVKSVSVTLAENIKHTTTAEWSVGFSVKNVNYKSIVDYKNITVSVKSLSGDSTTAVFPGFRQHPSRGYVEMMNFTVYGTLPRLANATNGLVDLPFDVNFRAYLRILNWTSRKPKLHVVESTCTHLKIQLGPYQTEGTLLGGDVTCYYPDRSFNATVSDNE